MGTPASDADQGKKRPLNGSPDTPTSLPSVGTNGGVDGAGGGSKRARTGDAGAAGRAGVGAGGGGGGGNGGEVFDGQGYHLTRLEGEQPPQPHGVGDAATTSTLTLPGLLEPRDRLTHLFIVAGTINPTWMITHGGLANLPSSLEAPPTIIYQNNNDRDPMAGEARPTAKSALQAASPALPPEAQWEVFQHPKKGLVQHAKLLLLRFGPGAGADGEDGGPGFLRVCIGSSNLYPQWGHSRGVYGHDSGEYDAESSLTALTHTQHKNHTPQTCSGSKTSPPPPPPPTPTPRQHSSCPNPRTMHSSSAEPSIASSVPLPAPPPPP